MNLFCACLLVIALVGSHSKSIVKASERNIEEFRKSMVNRGLLENGTGSMGHGSSESLKSFGTRLLDINGPDTAGISVTGNPEFTEISLKNPTVELANGEGRTFGIRRLQFMLMPLIYKMGVMMTLLVVLTVISLKGLAIGVILLILKLSAIFGKFYSHGHSSGPAWSPLHQPLHVHLHNSGGGHQYHHPPSPPQLVYHGMEPASAYADDEHYYYRG